MSKFYYNIEGTIINEGGTYLPLQGGSLKSLSIINEYDNLVFPAIIVEIMSDTDSYNFINEKTKIKLSIRRFQEGVDGFDYLFRDLVFSVLDKEQFYSPFKDYEIDENTDNLISFKVFLMLENDINISKINLSGNYINTDLNSIMLKGINKISNKKILYEKSDNNTVFKQIMIPPNMSLFNSLKYVDNIYGCYHNGIKIYCDIDKFYIFSDFQNKLNEKKDLILSILDQKTKILPSENLLNTITVFSNDLTYKNIKHIKDKIVGNNNYYVMENNKGELLKVKGKNENNDFKRRKVYYVNSSNPFAKDLIEDDKNVLIGFNCFNYNYSDFNCINRYIINDKNNTFKDAYFIIKKSMNVFRRTNENAYELSGQFTLKMI